ncbi:MAG: 7-carboxy-7-deazaguanine synthase QueE [Zoogloeaceae bacterium]|jgi:7-carboxy-7-deazaguanine synthase|nr:7-carboxy-7-deazaguanine synthase QueE [Zoogloeaceae bacterium]
MEADEALGIRVSEIFFSLQGEASRVGWPTTFVRLTGCPLRCAWCDTAYAFAGGERMTITQVLARVAAYPARQVCVTGGEPLAQSGALPLLRQLCDRGYEVSLETSGVLDIAPVDARVFRVLDLKAPASGEAGRNRWENLACLTPNDEIKIIIASRDDYDWACARLREHRLTERCPVLFSPAAPTQPPRELAEWILADGLPVRFQMQLHRLIWGNMRGK